MLSLFRSAVQSSKQSIHSWNGEEVGSASELIGLGVSARTFIDKKEGKACFASMTVIVLGIILYFFVHITKNYNFPQFLQKILCLIFWKCIRRHRQFDALLKVQVSYLLIQGLAVPPPTSDAATTSGPVDNDEAPQTEPIYSAIALQPPNQSNTPHTPIVGPHLPDQLPTAAGVKEQHTDEEVSLITTQVSFKYSMIRLKCFMCSVCCELQFKTTCKVLQLVCCVNILYFSYHTHTSHFGDSNSNKGRMSLCWLGFSDNISYSSNALHFDVHIFWMSSTFTCWTFIYICVLSICCLQAELGYKIISAKRLAFFQHVSSRFTSVHHLMRKSLESGSAMFMLLWSVKLSMLTGLTWVWPSTAQSTQKQAPS